MNNIYAIGDIHGNLDKLQKIIVKINPDNDDLFVFTGDYIDRGEDSKGVIDFLIYFSKKYKCIFLIGNHEDMMLSYMKNKDISEFELWKRVGGNETIKSYNGSIYNMPQSHKDFFGSLKLKYETDKYFFSHAGIDPNKNISNQSKQDLLLIRDDFILEKTNINKKVIYGHTAEMFLKPIHNDKICIDGGVAYGGSIIALKLPEETKIKA